MLIEAVIKNVFQIRFEEMFFPDHFVDVDLDDGLFLKKALFHVHIAIPIIFQTL
jgi:hypothetical protein